MVQLRCPKCATLVLAEAGETIRCPSCGFSATAPGGANAPARPPQSSPAAPRPHSPTPAPGRPVETAATEPNPRLRIPRPPPRPPVQTSAATDGQPLRVLSVWAFLLAFVALGTFHFARYGVPFILGASAAVMGVTSYAKDRKDRHGLFATILGCVALAIGAVYLSVQ